MLFDIMGATSVSVPAAGIRICDSEDLAEAPFDLRLVDQTLEFVLSRLTPHLVDEPSTDSERMASALAEQARRSALHTRMQFPVVGLGELSVYWRPLAEMARMWSDHRDYQADYGRETFEFPKPVPTHMRVRVSGDWNYSVATGRPCDTVVPVADFDDPQWQELRVQRRLGATDLYLPMPNNGTAQVWSLISPRRAARLRMGS